MGKQESGAQKRKRKEKQEELVKSQKGAMDKFIRKQPSQGSSGNQSVDPSSLPLAIIPIDEQNTDNIEVEEDHIADNLNSSPVADDDDSLDRKSVV